MATNATIPQQIMDYSLYSGTKKLFGMGETLTLPDIVFKTMTATLSSGDIDLPSLMTENLEQEFLFNVLDKSLGSAISFTTAAKFTVRAAVQHTNASTHSLEYKQIKVEYKGFPKQIKLGELKRADKMDSGITLSLSYIKVTVDSAELLEIDKLNNVIKVNGIDIRSKISDLL